MQGITHSGFYRRFSQIVDKATYFSLIMSAFCLPLSVSAAEILIPITAGLAILSGRFVRHFNMQKQSPIVWTVLWFLLLVILGLTWSSAPWADRLHALQKYSKLLYIPFLAVACIEVKWRDRAIMGYLAGVTITVIISYLRYLAGLHIGTRFDSPGAIFYSHIESSFFIAFACYLLAIYAWKKPRYRILCLILLAAFTYQEFFINDGRTGVMAYLLLLILFTVQITGWKGSLLGIAAIAVLAFMFSAVSPAFRDMLSRSTQDLKQYQHGQVETSLGYRLSFDSVSWQLFKKRMWLGYGTGSFGSVFQQSGGVPGMPRIDNPHNDYVMVSVEYGLVGLASLLLFFFTLIFYSFRLGEMRFFAQGLALAFMSSAFYNAFLYSAGVGHFYVLFIALFYGHFLHLAYSSKYIHPLRDNLLTPKSPAIEPGKSIS